MLIQKPFINKFGIMAAELLVFKRTVYYMFM
jgi:hypothetical protein